MSSEAPLFAPPIDRIGRNTMLRQGTSNERSSDGSGTVSYGLDSSLLVEFYSEPVHMEYLSKVAGHPIFQERIFTRIVMPGNRLTIVVHQTKGISYEQGQDPESGEYITAWNVMDQQENGDPVEPEKYPNAWRRFLKKGVASDSGYPIEEWGTVTRSFAMSLKAQNIHTVESLASLSDSMAQGVMGGIKYRDLAKAFLDATARDKILASEQEKAAQWAETASVLKKQVENLQEEVLRLQHDHRNGTQGQDPRLQSQLSQQREVSQFKQETQASNQIKAMSKKDANKRHELPQGKPGEA